MKPTAYKIGEWERKWLSKDMQEVILAYEEENKNLKLTLEQMENTCKNYLNDRDTLREENRKLKEERDFFKEQAILWRNDYKNEYEENKKLKAELEFYKKQYKHSMWEEYIDKDLYDLDC